MDTVRPLKHMRRPLFDQCLQHRNGMVRETAHARQDGRRPSRRCFLTCQIGGGRGDGVVGLSIGAVGRRGQPWVWHVECGPEGALAGVGLGARSSSGARSRYTGRWRRKKRYAEGRAGPRAPVATPAKPLLQLPLRAMNISHPVPTAGPPHLYTTFIVTKPLDPPAPASSSSALPRFTRFSLVARRPSLSAYALQLSCSLLLPPRDGPNAAARHPRAGDTPFPDKSPSRPRPPRRPRCAFIERPRCHALDGRSLSLLTCRHPQSSLSKPFFRNRPRPAAPERPSVVTTPAASSSDVATGARRCTPPSDDPVSTAPTARHRERAVSWDKSGRANQCAHPRYTVAGLCLAASPDPRTCQP